MTELKSRLLVATMVLVAGVSHANYMDDFNAGVSTNWTEYDPIATAVGGGSFATFSNPASAYRIEASPSPAPSQTGPGRAMSFREDHTFTDVTMTWDVLDWDNTQKQIFGGAARAINIGLGSTDGYAFVYGPKNNSTGAIDLLLFQNEEYTQVTATVPLTLLDSNDYRFIFTLEGTSLTGDVYDLTTGGASPIATISGVDGTISSGVTGLIIADSSSSASGSPDVTFDNVGASYTPLVLVPADLWYEVTNNVIVIGADNLVVGATNELQVSHNLINNSWSNVPPAFVTVTSTNWTLPINEIPSFYRIKSTAP